MKVQLRHILIRAAIDDEPVAGGTESEFGGEIVHGEENIGEERGVFRGYTTWAGDGLLGHEQDVHRVAGLGMVKGDQGGSLAQAVEGEGKTYVREGPAETEPGKG